MTMKSVSAHNVEYVEEKRHLQRLPKLQNPTFGNHVYSSHATNPNFLYGDPTPINSLRASSTSSVESNCLRNVEVRKERVNGLNGLVLTAPEIIDSCTQTSKTILQLAKLEVESLTPDSLMQSPRNSEMLDKANNFNIKQLQCKFEGCAINPENTSSHTSYTLDGSVYEHDVTPIPFSRKNNLSQYLNGYGPTASIPSEQEILAYPKASLTEMFLLKKKQDEKSDSSNCRSAFLQQTSPLRNLKSPLIGANHFKSQSCIDQSNPQHSIRSSSHVSRFTVKSVKAQQSINGMESGENSWLSKSKNLKRTHDNQIKSNRENGNILKPQRSGRKSNNTSPISSSFMSPTFASERRNQARLVNNLKDLITPTSRGKSLSPPRGSVKSSRIPKAMKHLNINVPKIPYIDQSQSQLSIEKVEPPKKPFGRKSINRYTGSPTALISPAATSPKFDEDLLKIDLQSLHVKLSEGSLKGTGRASYTSSITSFDNAVLLAMSHIRDPDWSESLNGLAEIIELCRTIDHDIIFPHMTAVNQRLLELLRSPRSHVCRTACQAAGHLFETMKDTRRPEFDDIVENLLYKTADANKFIRKDANLALDCMVTHIPIFHAVRSLCLKGPTHKNGLVRTATARLIICAVVIAGPCAVLNVSSHEASRKRIILHMAKFLADKDPETRKYGERLYKIFSKEPLFETSLKKYMEKDEITAMKISLKYKNQKR